MLVTKINDKTGKILDRHPEHLNQIRSIDNV
jgi:hypothetical protein